MTDIPALIAANSERWARAKLLRSAEFDMVAKRLCASVPKARYQWVSQKTGVPWAIIAVIHEREASQRWDTQLGQGDPLNEVSHNRPAGRGPFDRWEYGALDALMNCSPHAANWKDWSIGGALTLLEEYNGLGYSRMGRPSPYVWAGTDQYASGKYVADGKYDPAAVDKQLGCAGLLKSMTKLDPTITFNEVTK